MNRRLTRSIVPIGLALAALTLSVEGSRVLAPNPAAGPDEYLLQRNLEDAPPFAHWDLRTLPQASGLTPCAVPWVRGIVPDINTNGTPDDAEDRRLVLQAFERSFDAWRRVDPAVIDFVGGVAPGAQGLKMDRGNVLSFPNAAPDDVQIVPLGGLAPDPDSVVVSSGPNGVLESHPMGDDQVAFGNIVAGANRRCETVANAGGFFPAAPDRPLARTALFFNNRTGEILEADIAFDGAERWTINAHDTVAPVVGGVQTFDLQMAATHEIGHFIGIAHPRDSGRANPAPLDLMNPVYDPTRRCNHRLSDDDRQACNYLYTPDLGDAPDPFTVPPTFNVYPTLVHRPIDSPILRTLNGRPIFAPALGPAHLYGFRGPSTYARFRFEWLGDDMNDDAAECEALVPNMDMFDDGVASPRDFYWALGDQKLRVVIRHTDQPGRYDRADRRTHLFFNGYLDISPTDGLFTAIERYFWWEGTPAENTAYSDNWFRSERTPGRIVLHFDMPGLPPTAGPVFYARWRLDYGEDEGRVANVSGDLAGAVGAAQFGEVEDDPYQSFIDCNFNGCADPCEVDPSCAPVSCFMPPAPDCNTNLMPDDCEDCNGTGLADVCDTAFGLSLDCDTNTFPDECQEDDANSNGTPDPCDILADASLDCDTDGIPDEIEDCDTNGRGDDCDVADGIVADCDNDGVPDVCMPDCNADGTPDVCQWSDCNTNLTLDECDLAAGSTIDCNTDGFPDECNDCNTDGLADECNVAYGGAADCNSNLIPDPCEPDTLDCDGSGVADACDAPPHGPVRISVDSAGQQSTTQSTILPASISADGRFVVFQWGDLNTNTGLLDQNQIYVRDRDTDADGVLDEPGTVATILASANTAGQPCNAVCNPLHSTSPPRDISADGRYVVFDTAATDVVTPDAGAFVDVFIRDMQTGVTTRIDAPGGVQTNGNSFNPSISGNGRWVAFHSGATNLVTPDANFSTADVYVYDRTTTALRRVSISSGGVQPTSGASRHATISDDGRFVLFQSTASTLVPGDTNGLEDVFWHDRDTDADGAFDEPGAIATLRVNLASTGAQQIGLAFYPAMSADGAWAAFSTGEALVPADTNGLIDVYVRNMFLGPSSLYRASVGSGGVQAAGGAGAVAPSVSRTGRYVSFASDAANLAPDDDNGAFDVFVHDRDTTQTVLVSRSAARLPGNANSGWSNLSSDDRTLVFLTDAFDLVPGDTNGKADTLVVRFPGLFFDDCDFNAVRDSCDVDCDSNGTPDACDIALDSTSDCTTNGELDACEPDCNLNGVADVCEIALGAIADCDENGLPDDCQPDCNTNGVPDNCDVSSGASPDANANDFPDECDPPDCNSNQTTDEDEIAAGAPDCNTNGTPDECDIAGESEDCDVNGVPDECQPDCNGNGTIDTCDTSADCNSNGTPDECDVVDFNGIPVVVSNLPAEMGFVDISATGTPVPGTPADDTTHGATMPFSTVLIPNGHVAAGSNGILNLGTLTGSTSFGNVALPTAVLLTRAMCPFWDDLNFAVTGSVGTIKTETIGSAPNRTFIVQWTDAPHFGGTTGAEAITFQVQIFETPVDGIILAQYLYLDTVFGGGQAANDNGASATVGYQHSTTGPATNYLVNGVPASNMLSPSTVLSLRLPPNLANDCNTNGTLDECEFGDDCNTDGVPDECQLAGDDCNTNGTVDACDIANGASEDCNGNGEPDECDVRALPLSWDNTIAGTFIDLSTSTGATDLPLGDDTEANVTMPFTNAIFTSGDVRVGNNGAICFNRTTGDVGVTNTALPNNTVAALCSGAQALCPFWDDLDSDFGAVLTQTVGTAPNRIFIVEWDNRPHFSGTTAGVTGVTFQVQVFETPLNGNVYAQFVYVDTIFGGAHAGFDNGMSATIGYQASGLGPAAQWSFNTASVFGGTVLSLIDPTVSQDVNGNGIPDECEVACACPGDMDGGGAVDGGDIQCFVDCLYGQTPSCGSCDCADMDNDGDIDGDDQSAFAAGLLAGSTCP